MIILISQNFKIYNGKVLQIMQNKSQPREEFSDWPHGLLAIGTFGNKGEIKADLDEKNTQEDQ